MNAFGLSLPFLSLETLLLAQADSAWHRFLSNKDAVTLLIVFGFLTISVVVPSIAHYWYSARTRQWEASLKQSMIERGMSAQDIQAVLDAGKKK